ncbi:T4 RnlA family RNA ligase, partial [Herbiconiux daphne]
SDRLEFNVETPVTPKEFAEYSQANPNQVQMKEQANGNVSFNFSSRVFRSDKWNQVTSHARGLFMKEQDNGSWEVVARSYNKFFNDEQRRSTEANRLRQTVTFPVQVFKKYNGFLGLIGYDKTTGEPFVSSKAVQDISTKDTYANWVKDVFIEVYGQEHFDKVVALSKELDSTFI